MPDTLESFTVRVGRKLGWSSVSPAAAASLRDLFERWYTVDQACSWFIDLEKPNA